MLDWLVPSLIVLGAVAATITVFVTYGPMQAAITGAVLAFEVAAATAVIRLAGGRPKT